MAAALAISASLAAGCARDRADPPWIPTELAGRRVTRVSVHEHGYSSSEFWSHGLALLDDGSVSAFEANMPAYTNGMRSPEARPGISMPQVHALSGGDCAVFVDDTARCVRDGAWVTMATGVSQYLAYVLLQTPTGAETLSCALTTAGEVRCGAPAETGQVFEGAVRQAGGHRFVQLAGDGAAICAVASDGTVRCWRGLDDAGDDLPVTGAAEVAVGLFHACVRFTDGRVQCWGDNSQGQLGNGGVFVDQALANVEGLTDAVQIGAATNQTCARRATGEVRCWGDSGVLVELAPEARGRPQPVPSVSGAVDLALSDSIDCAAMDRGEVRCWGSSHRSGIERPMSSGGFFIPGR